MKDKKVIVVANNKGGVGKTTTAETMGTILALNKKVLLVDIDSQANLTTNNIKGCHKTIFDAITAQNASLPIYHVTNNLDITAADARLATVEFAVTDRPNKEYILKSLIDKERNKYDYIIIDCAPSFSYLTITAIIAADLAVIPVTAESIPIKGLAQFISTLQNIKTTCNNDLQIAGILITRYSRKRINNALIRSLRETYKNGIFKTVIRYNVAISEAAIQNQNIINYDADANGTADYKNFVEEFLQRIENEIYLTL